MPELLIEDPDGSEAFTVGGRPLAPPGTKWPMCRECGGPMQFLAQLPLADREQVLLLFQCQNDPGMCDEWDAGGGGNAALVIDAVGRVPLEVPDGETLLPGVSRLRLAPYEDTRADSTPDDAYCEAVDAGEPIVVGKRGGRPLWQQGDETPTCACGAPMTFVAQLEDRGGGGINFGDVGSGYAFVCATCPASAGFLWQCG